MHPEEEKYINSSFKFLINFLKVVLGMLCLVLIYETLGKKMDWNFSRPQLTEEVKLRNEQVKVDQVKNGIHVATGLVYAEGFEVVSTTCTACHSAKLVTQNRASRAGWEQMIDWMQATQGLWDLGENEPIILDYLATHYAPEEVGRRANLEEIEWYILEGDSD
ncbi:MAG: hypothetical protein AAFP82_15710 [Bacteroidota bacterium]